MAATMPRLREKYEGEICKELGDALLGPGMPASVHLFTATGRVLW